MVGYERQQVALPAGAKGTKGAGRSEHSTNTRLGEPATYAWTNASSSYVASIPSVTIADGVEYQTPIPRPKRNHTTKASAQSKNALDRLDTFQSNLSDISANLSSRSSGRQSFQGAAAMSESDKKKQKLITVRDDLQNQL